MITLSRLITIFQNPPQNTQCDVSDIVSQILNNSHYSNGGGTKSKSIMVTSNENATSWKGCWPKMPLSSDARKFPLQDLP